MTQQNLGTILIDKELEKIVFYKSKTSINQDYSTGQIFRGKYFSRDLA